MEAKRILSISAMLLLVAVASAQSYNGPESVEYDAANDRYLVSNTGSNEILARDQSGILSLFVSTSSSPYGLEILGNVVYACQSGGFVKGYDLTSGAEVFSVVTGASFLNGITTNGTDLFVTDFGADQVLKIDVAAQSSSVLVGNTNGTPNGIIWESGLNAVFVVFWGANAPLKAYSATAGTELYTIPTTLTNIDGITIDCQNTLYVSSWSPNAITSFSVGSTTGVQLPWTVNNPADLDYDSVNHRVCIPSSGNNTVALETITDCVTGINELESISALSVYPVPASQELFVETSMNEATSYSILDLQGRVILTGSVMNKEVVDVSSLAQGQYTLKLTDGRTAPFIKK